MIIHINAQDSPDATETNQMKKQISELKERLSRLKDDLQTKESELRHKEESHAKITSSLVEKHKSELNQSNFEWQQKLFAMEGEIRKQRERTISMLAEKEEEISELKFYTPSISGCRSPGMMNDKTSPKVDSVFSHRTMFPSSLPDESGIGASSAPAEVDEESVDQESESAIKHLLTRRSNNTMFGKETGNLLHFAQERARLEMNLALMRKQKNSAEATTREVQYLLVLRDEEHGLETNALKESLRKLERDVGRESANLEYLKNVMYQYMMCREGSSRYQMFNAISTILQFSPMEKQMVLASKGWRT